MCSGQTSAALRRLGGSLGCMVNLEHGVLVHFPGGKDCFLDAYIYSKVSLNVQIEIAITNTTAPLYNKGMSNMANLRKS